MTTAIWRSLDEVPDDGRRSVVTLGNFDGVHRGHRAVLEQVVAEAAARGDRSVAVTFDPHPLAVHYPDRPLVPITGLDDRLARMAELGLDAILVIPYTREFADQTGAEFVRTYLFDGLRASGVVIGHDTKFGRDNASHAEGLRALGDQLGFTVDVLDWAGVSNDSDRRWSSTWVRELLGEGRVAEAAEILGRPHRVRGVIVHGDALGKTLGFPTANLDVSEGMVPGSGVYAGWLTVVAAGTSQSLGDYVGARWPAAVSLGINYTVGGTEQRVEAHLIDLEDLDLYGMVVALDFVERRRGMVDFGSIDALKVALAEDVVWCREVLDL